MYAYFTSYTTTEQISTEFGICVYTKSCQQGRIKGFVDPRHFSSLDPFGNSKSIVGTTVYSRLSGLREGVVCTDNPNFVFYTPTVPVTRNKLRNVLLSHTSHFTGRLIVEFWF
jgi:hypothetical protein